MLVAQIKFAEWSTEGILRQPVFPGLRAEKAARALRREATAAPANPHPA
jgi:bifunctional non-homologous end joining protein LigD